MSVTAIGSQSPGGENTVTASPTEAPSTNFLEIMEGSSPAGAHTDNTAAGPATGKLLSLLPEVEQGRETDHEVAISIDGAPESVLAVGMAMTHVAPTPGADSRAMGAPAAVASVSAVEASGPSLPITALPSHVLGTDLAASGVTPLASAGGSPVDAATPGANASPPGAAIMVTPAHGPETVDPATISALAKAAAAGDVDAPTATPVPAASAPAVAAGTGENRASAAPVGTPIAAGDAPGAPVPPISSSASGGAPTAPTAPAVAPVVAPEPIASPDDAPQIAPMVVTPATTGPATADAATASARATQGDALAVIRQVADAMQVSIRRGDDVLRLQLRPAELGTVVIHLVKRDGGLYAHVRADSPEAVQALQQSLGGLVDTLQAQGQMLAGLDVALRQPGDDATPDFARDARGASRRASAGDDDPSNAVSLAPSTPSTSAIDLRA